MSTVVWLIWPKFKAVIDRHGLDSIGWVMNQVSKGAMMEYQNTIVLYESVAAIMKDMLHAARMQDWDTLAALESDCAQHVEVLKAIENSEPLPSDALKRKVESIKSILADDREIRNLASPWMAKLNKFMHHGQTEQRLTQACGR